MSSLLRQHRHSSPLTRIYVVGPLDYERQKSYRLTVRLTDTHNDLDPENQQSCLCDVAVRLQPLIITRTETTWSPPAWFVAALTVSGALLLAALGCTAQTLLASQWGSFNVFCICSGLGLGCWMEQSAQG
uniref:Cadherin domain-containing protein n=1 Tax=Apteryx owenii TaxID=8824 RepID=A0A8B9PGK1_APTOW